MWIGMGDLGSAKKTNENRRRGREDPPRLNEWGGGGKRQRPRRTVDSGLKYASVHAGGALLDLLHRDRLVGAGKVVVGRQPVGFGVVRGFFLRRGGRGV